ncbi:unnamed protein product [Linum trigynum]
MLINMYSKCGSEVSARKVFDRMTERTLVSYNTIISAYAQKGDEENALFLFVQMRREGNNPLTEFTVSSVLCACASKCDVLTSKQLHCFSIKNSMDENVFVGTALLDVYSKSGFVHDASRVFEGMPEKSDVTWSSMAAGLVQNKLYEEALVLYTRARATTGLETDNKFTISSIISACAGLAAFIEGRQVHSVVCKTGFESNNFIASSLVDMYAKCGAIKDAFRLFQNIQDKNLVLWNVMISALAKHSRSLEVMVLFEKMQQAGLEPDEVTYISVLSACGHMGLVKEGRTYFYLMTELHHLSPNVLHYSCMVDVLSRAGLVREAYELMKDMPFDPTAPMWGSLLGSCRVHGNVELAEVAAGNLFEIEPGNAANYVMLSNTYAAGRQWEGVASTRKLLKENDGVMKKERGKSWVEIKDKVHTFMAGERKHPRIMEILLELDRLMEETKKRGGYKPDAGYELHDVEQGKKLELLKHHSEKLAVCFGLMSLPEGIPIRIMKNLRICGDCHSFMKSVSSVEGREIIVRDTNRFHHFWNGHCSCNDFW